ncbi:MAG TPA: discoidin domain-containing protein [Actinoplanes sp.]|nr:discoidin domain-containing protein [Actinoplanes sp.]
MHDETFLSRVYFLNNVFYNTSASTSTPWYRRAGALRQAVFSNNAYYEKSGTHSAQEPADPRGVRTDPRFTGDPAVRVDGEGIQAAAQRFVPRTDSPLVDAGRYNPHLGTADTLGTHLYYGPAPGIGIVETQRGTRVDNPVDTDPIENSGGTGVNLALGKPVTASSTHAGAGGTLGAVNLTDGNPSTRWAAADNATYPVTLDIDFGAPATFDQVYLDEYTDSGTNPRVATFTLQRWDTTTTAAWVTIGSFTGGIGHDRTVTGFGTVTTGRLRVALTGKIATEVYTPTMTEVAVYKS